MNIDHWTKLIGLDPRTWTCGHCGRSTGNNRGYKFQENEVWVIYICPGCIKPTFFDGINQFPGASHGNMVDHLPGNIGPLYQEARNCMVVSATTAAVLTCRKILMHVSAEKGAGAGQSFQAYVNYLITADVIPAHFKTWVDHIREKSNEANHELVLMTQKEAEDLLSFTEMLLKVVYEYPIRAVAASGS